MKAVTTVSGLTLHLQGSLQQSCNLRRIRLTDDDIGRSVPLGQAVQCASQVGQHPFGNPYAWFHMQRFDLEHPLRSMRLEIQPADELAAMQDGQREIAVSTLCSRRITFDPIVEAEQLQRSLPVPYQRIEW